MGAFTYMRPDESFLYGTVTGTVELTYDQDWLLDGRPFYPVRGTTGLSLTATAPAARTVSLIAVVNHNLTGSIGISGGVTATVPAAIISNGIALNPWVAVTPVSASSLVMAVTQTPSIVGLLMAGTARTLGRQLVTAPVFDPGEPFAWEGEYGGVTPYDVGVEARRLVGETILSDAGLADVASWFLSTRQGTRPTLIIPIASKNDAWLVTFRYTYESIIQGSSGGHSGFHRVRFEFVEIPRVRWV